MIFASNSILSSTRVLGTRSTISIKELFGVSARIGLTVCAILASLGGPLPPYRNRKTWPRLLDQGRLRRDERCVLST